MSREVHGFLTDEKSEGEFARIVLDLPNGEQS